MDHSSSKRKRLREWSVEELQEELRKRQCRVDEGRPRSRSKPSNDPIAEEEQSSDTDAVVPYGPDASSVSLMVAIEKLKQLFENLVGRCRNRYSYRDFVFPHEHAAFLLKVHPSIVSEAFRKRTVLSYFLQAKAPLETVKGICKLYKDHLRNNQSTGTCVSYNFYRAPNPIGDVCLYGPGAKGVLQYFVKEFPENILMRDRQNRLPIELFLNRILNEKPDDEFNDLNAAIPRKISYPILECLLSACPRMLEHCRNSSIYMSKILDNYSISSETKLVLSEKFSRGCHVDSIAITKKAGTVSVPEIMAVCKFLPSLKVCSILPKDMYEDAARVFNASLYSMDCSNLAELGIPLLTDYHPDREDSSGKFLTLRAIRNCRNLKKLSLQIVGYDRKKCDSCMSLCTDIIKENPRVESLELRNFRLKNSATMSEFLSSMKNVRDLVFENLRIDKARWCMNKIPTDAKLETLRLHADLKVHWVPGLLLQLVQEMPTLKSLRLDHWKRGGDENEVSNLTSILEAVLRENQIEEFEVLAPCTLEMNRICDVLKTNTKLDRLAMPACNTLVCQKLVDAFELHNTSVRRIEIQTPQQAPPTPVQREEDDRDIMIFELSSDEDSILSYFGRRDRRQVTGRGRSHAQPTANEETEQQRITKKILYYVMLNRFGRAKARDAKTSTAQLVGLLCKVANEPSFEVDLMMRQNVQLGLLLSAPNIWAGAQ